MIRTQVVVAVMMVGLTVPAAAQRGAVDATAEIQQLRDSAYLVERDLSSLSQRDTARAEALQLRLEDLQEEIVYLKVKQRKEGSVQRREYADLRVRLEGLRTEARTASMPAASVARRRRCERRAAGPALRRGPGRNGDGRAPDRQPRLGLSHGRGSVRRHDRRRSSGRRTRGDSGWSGGAWRRDGVNPATRTNRTARMTLSFDQVTVNGQAHPIRGTVTEAIEGSGIKGEAGRLGVGAGAGAVIGGLLGGVKGALLGVAIGGAGTLAATEGKEVRVPQGSVLRVRFDSPVQMQASR